MSRLVNLREHGRMTWAGAEHGWVARPDDVVEALCHEGFEEYKRTEARSRRDREPTGGVWQGLDTRTGTVASAIWVGRSTAAGALVFIEIDGERLEGGE